MARAMITRLEIEYDGGGFAGWARQPGQRTVQGELERALGTILRTPVALTVAGRTDRGVHALRQVASYAGAPPPLMAVNALTPPELAVLDAREAPEGFDARRHAVSRTYCFRLLNRRVPSAFERTRALHWPTPLDRSLLHACAALLPGRHEFTAFTPRETSHTRFDRRVLSAAWREDADLLEFWITADAFMRHMNRTLVGTMLEVAGGRRDLASFATLLEGRPRHEAGPSAAPHGLYFVCADYPAGDVERPAVA